MSGGQLTSDFRWAVPGPSAATQQRPWIRSFAIVAPDVAASRASLVASISGNPIRADVYTGAPPEVFDVTVASSRLRSSAPATSIPDIDIGERGWILAIADGPCVQSDCSSRGRWIELLKQWS